MGLFADRRRLSRWRRIADGCGHQSCQHETSRCPRLTEPYLSKPSIISSGRAMKFEINVRHQRAAAKVLAGDYLRLSSYKLVEQHLGLLQIGRIEAFGEQAVDRSEKLASLGPLTLVRQSRAILVAARSQKRTCGSSASSAKRCSVTCEGFDFSSFSN
jgi:hypothetical protein